MLRTTSLLLDGGRSSTVGLSVLNQLAALVRLRRVEGRIRGARELEVEVALLSAGELARAGTTILLFGSPDVSLRKRVWPGVTWGSAGHWHA